jgi:hypothetical protein
MKKLLMILAVVLLAISCEKEGDIELSKSDLVGKWNVTKVTQDGETTDLPSGAITVDLKSDGKYYVVFLGDTYTGAYTVGGNTVTGISGSITEYFEFTSLSGNKAKIDYKNTDGDIYKFEAVKI